MKKKKKKGKLRWGSGSRGGGFIYYISRKFWIKYCLLDEAAFAADKSLISAK
jgi:hypothetical protein